METFAVYDEGIGGKLVVGDILGLLKYVKSCATELEDGETMEVIIQRKDMTDEEIEALPVI